MTEGCLASLDVIPINPCVNQSAALLPAVTSLISLLGVAGLVGGAVGTIVLDVGDTSPIKSMGLLKSDMPLALEYKCCSVARMSRPWWRDLVCSGVSAGNFPMSSSLVISTPLLETEGIESSGFDDEAYTIIAGNSPDAVISESIINISQGREIPSSRNSKSSLVVHSKSSTDSGETIVFR